MDISFQIFNESDELILRNKYNQIIEYISQILINIKSPLKFFGHFFMTLEKKVIFINEQSVWRENNKIEMGFVYIEDNTLIFVIDPDVINDEFATFKILFKVLHEIIHCVFKHKSRQPSNIKDALVFQLAADHVTNSVLYQLYQNKEITKVCHFPEKEFFIKRFFDADKNDSAESIYKKIKSSNDFEITSKQIKVPIDKDGKTLNKIFVKEYLGTEEYNDQFNLGLKNLKTIDNLDPEFNLYSDKNVINDISSKSDYLKDLESSLLKEPEVFEDKEVTAKITKSFKTKEQKEKEKEDSEFNISGNFDSIDSLLKQSLINVDNSSEVTEDEETTSLNYDYFLEYIIINVLDKQTNKNYNVLYDLSNFNATTQEIEHNGPVYFEKYKENLSKGIPGIGSTTSDRMSIFDKLFRVKYPWDEILKNAITTRSVLSEDRSFSKYDKYRNHLGIGIFAGQVEKQVPDVLVAAIDSSGSMSDTDLKKIISILCDSYGKYSEIIIYVHDMLVVDTIVIEEASTQESIFTRLSQIKGGGGTSHRDAFQKIQDLSEEKILSTIIFFTDFYSDVSNVFEKYNFLKFNNTIWCISGPLCQNGNFKVELKDIDTMTILIEDTIVR